MTDIRKMGAVSSAAAASLCKIDNYMLKETQKFVTTFVLELSRNKKLMAEMKNTGFYLLREGDGKTKQIAKIVSASLKNILRNSADPGAKFLSSTFVRFKKLKMDFIYEIPEILYWASLPIGDNAQRLLYEGNIKDIIWRTTLNLHTRLLKESPYIYKEVCEETRTGRKVTSKLNRHRARRAAAKKTSKILSVLKAKIQASDNLINKTEVFLRRQAASLVPSKNLIEVYQLERKICAEKGRNVNTTRQYSNALKALRAEISKNIMWLSERDPEYRFLKEILDARPEAERDLTGAILGLTKAFVDLSRNGKDLVIRKLDRPSETSLNTAKEILAQLDEKYPDAFRQYVLKIREPQTSAPKAEAPETKKMPRSKPLRDVLNRPPAVVEKGKRFERVKVRVFKI